MGEGETVLATTVTEEDILDNIIVKNGRVSHFQLWSEWKGDPFPLITINRLEDGRFSIAHSEADREKVFKSKVESLKDGLEGLDEEFIELILELFKLENPEESNIRALHNPEAGLLIFFTETKKDPGET